MGQSGKQRFNVVHVLAISAAFLMILSTINLSSSSYLPLLSPFTNEARAASISNVAFGGGGGWLNFLNSGALQSWYSQCLASLGTTAASPGLPTTTNGITNPFIGGAINTNNGLTSTTTASTDSCAQQLQSYISQLLSSFQQCIMSATMGGGFGGGASGGVGFSMAMRECAMLMLEQQQQSQNGLQTPNTGNSNLINGLGSTITNPFATTNTAPSLTTTSPSTSTLTASNNPFTTQYPTTSNGNFGPFQNLNPNGGIINNGSTETGSSIVNNNGLNTISPQQ